MAELHQYLERLDTDPGDEGAFAALKTELSKNGAKLDSKETFGIFDRVRKSLRERGELEMVAQLVDIEFEAIDDKERQADLLLEKGDLYANDLLEDAPAVACYKGVLELRPD